jgi:hypothetical protein
MCLFKYCLLLWHGDKELALGIAIASMETRIESCTTCVFPERIVFKHCVAMLFILSDDRKVKSIVS